MSIEEILKLSDQSILRGTDPDDGKRYLGKVLAQYAADFGEQPCASCPGRALNYIKKLKSKYMDAKTENTSNSGSFKLRKGVVIPILGTSNSYSEENMTDEIAIKLLKRNPNSIKLYASYPENWKELIAGTASATVAEATTSAATTEETSTKTEETAGTQTEVATTSERPASITEIEAMPMPAIRKLFPGIGGKTKAELVANIQSKYPELNGTSEEKEGATSSEGTAQESTAQENDSEA